MKAKFTLITFFSLVLSAQGFAAGVNDRQQNQSQRIAQGVNSAELTARETRNLARQQRHIARTEAKFKSDGQFTAKERVIVQQKQNRASANIYRQKHDLQNRK